MVATKNLKFITQARLSEKIENHFKFMRWDKKVNHNFNNYNYTDWYKWEWEKKETFKISSNAFISRDLTEANFQNSDVTLMSFQDTILKWADFRWSIYNSRQFSKTQLKDIILTDRDHKKYQEKKKIMNENNILKEKVSQKDEVLASTSKTQIHKLTGSFEELEHRFRVEERQWLIIWFILFMCLLLFLSIPIFDIFAYQYTYKIILLAILFIIGLIWSSIIAIATANMQDEVKEQKVSPQLNRVTNKKITEQWKLFIYNLWRFIKNILTGLKKFFIPAIVFWPLYIYFIKYIVELEEPTESIFDLSSQYILLPLWLLLSSFLYFCIFRYSKVSQLRIENQNKVALLHWLIAIKADTDEWMSKSRYYDNIADVVFTKVYNSKTADQNLPIDKIIDIIKIIDQRWK